MKMRFFRILALCTIMLGGCISKSFDSDFPFIETDSELLREEARVAEGQDVIAGAFKVVSNQSWSARVIYADDDAPEWCSLLVSEHENLSGDRVETVVPFVLGENRYFDSRQATVRLTSADCEAAVIIEQAAAVPYVTIPVEQCSVAPEAEYAEFPVISNTPWTVTLKDAALWPGFSIRTWSEDKVCVVFPQSFTPQRKSAVLTFAWNGGEKDLTVSQDGMVITLNFLEWPFSESLSMADTENSAVISNGAYTLPWHGNDYTFTFRLSGDSQYDNEYFRFMDSNVTGSICISKSWIELPAIQGMKLTSVTVIGAAGKKNWGVTENGKVEYVEGGAEHKVLLEERYTWTIASPEVNHGYSLYTSENKSRLREITLIYK